MKRPVAKPAWLSARPGWELWRIIVWNRRSSGPANGFGSRRNAYEYRAWAVCLLALTLLAATGCEREPIKWDPAMKDYFAHSAARPTDPPREYWQREDETLFLRRVGHADVVAVGSLRMVRLHDHHGKPLHVAYAFRPRRVLYGDVDSRVDDDDELILTLDRASPDFQSALLAEKRLPGKTFLLLLKEKPNRELSNPDFSGWRASLWRRPATTTRKYVWSLYRPEPQILGWLEALYQHLEEHGD